MEKFYKICCLVMTIVLLGTFAVTMYVGFTGKNPNGALFGRIAVLTMLSVIAALTVFAVVFLQAGGKPLYKIGFYLVHCGAVVLIVGFLITNLTQAKYNVYLEPGSSYSTFRFDDGSSFTLDDRMGLESVKTEYYQNGQPRSYTAVLALYDTATGEKKEERTLTVNHPARIQGYKVYLMNISGEDEGAALLIKYNPGEYVVILGIAATLCGIFLTCFAGVEKAAGNRGKPARLPKKEKGGATV